MIESGNPLYFFWGDWAHGKDLMRRKIVQWNIIVVNDGDSVPSGIERCAVAVPINVTWHVIARILLANPEAYVESLAWIMWLANHRVACLHALWWPNSQEDFRIVHATDGVEISVSRGILDRAKELWIRWIPRTSMEHNKGMAFHQALTHAVIILHDSTPGKLKISPWTSPQTIADMILYNPFFLEVWNELIFQITSGKTLGEAYMICMKEADIDLSTPNSLRQVSASSTWDFAPSMEIMSKISCWASEVTNTALVHIINDSRTP